MERRQRQCWKILLALLTSCAWSANGIQRFRAVDVLNQVVHVQEDIRQGLGKLQQRSPRAQEYDTVQELNVTQPLDHFSKHLRNDPSTRDNRTFQQRYFYSDRFTQHVSRINPPVYAFLCVGGEGPSLDKSVLVDSVHCSGDMVALARILNREQEAIVHMFALEHRYYGTSYPEFTDRHGKSESPVTNENLVYLSSRQALADLAHFVQTMTKKHHLPVDTNWIAFGGSYPGMISGWARLEYPELIHAAVSNSAPVQARLYFGAYNDRVAFDLQYDKVGGSLECLQLVLEGHQEIVESLQRRDYGEVADWFNLCDADSLRAKENARLFLGDGVIEIPAQSNDPHCDSALCNIDKLCQAMLVMNESLTPVQVLANISRTQKGDDCLVLDWNETLRSLASPEAQRDGLRSWFWQTCTEFGFYQTCEDDSFCPFARGYHPLEMDLDICKIAFGVDEGTVRQNVKRSLAYYGGWNMNATRIFSVNGDVDPWSMLALTNDRSRENLPTHWVKGASHHFWTHQIEPSDDVAVADARIMIHLRVMQWLETKDYHDQWLSKSGASEQETLRLD